MIRLRGRTGLIHVAALRTSTEYLSKCGHFYKHTQRLFREARITCLRCIGARGEVLDAQTADTLLGDLDGR